MVESTQNKHARLDPSDVEAEIQRHKTALLFRNAGISQLVHVVNGSMLAFVSTTLHTKPLAAAGWWLPPATCLEPLWETGSAHFQSAACESA